jgi:hypothetical protein
MEQDYDMLIKGIHNLIEAYDKLSRGVPNRNVAIKRADEALGDVLESISGPEISTQIDRFIVGSRDMMPENFNINQLPIDERQKLIKGELEATKELRTRERDISDVMDILYRNLGQQKHFVSNSADMADMLRAYHKNMLNGIYKATEMPRKDKKKYKKDLKRAGWCVLFGAGCIIANIAYPPLAAFSYGLGGSALFEAGLQGIGN